MRICKHTVFKYQGSLYVGIIEVNVPVEGTSFEMNGSVKVAVTRIKIVGEFKPLNYATEFFSLSLASKNNRLSRRCFEEVFVNLGIAFCFCGTAVLRSFDVPCRASFW